MLKLTCGVVVCPLVMMIFLSLLTLPVASQKSQVPTAIDRLNGKTLEKLAQEFWQWEVTMPPGDIPKDPKTNLHDCRFGYDENKTTIFLASPYDKSYSSKCIIPPDKFLLVPLLVGECDPTVPEERTKSGKIEDLWACAREADEPFDIWEVVRR